MPTERPQRPVSKEAQQAIAASLDADAEWAEKNGYTEGAENLRGRAAQYRQSTGQTQG